MKELPIDDIALLREFRNRDRESINKLHDIFYDRLYWFARSYLKEDKDQAHDAVIDAFMALLNAPEEFEGVISIKGWLFNRVRWICLDALKRKVSQNLFTPTDEFMEVADEDATVVERRIKAEVISEVFQVLDKLPNRHKTIIKLSFLEQKKNEEIAAILHLSVKRVKNIRTDLLKTIKNELVRKSLMVFVLSFLSHLLRIIFKK